MLIRICLAVATLFGVLTLVVSQMMVKPFIVQTKGDLETAQKDLSTARNSESAAKRARDNAMKESEQARKELDTTKANLEDASAKAQQQEARANKLEQERDEVLLAKNQAQDRLAKWEAFGVTPEKVREVLAQNKKLVSDNDALGSENQVLDREVIRLKDRLMVYEGEKTKVDLPAGLRGKVLAVDPKYDFVILDIGQDDGLLERGEMLVNRAGKLVAKIRILSVQSKRSVANVLPDWKQADVMEGDQVLVGL